MEGSTIYWINLLRETGWADMGEVEPGNSDTIWGVTDYEIPLHEMAELKPEGSVEEFIEGSQLIT